MRLLKISNRISVQNDPILAAARIQASSTLSVHIHLTVEMCSGFLDLNREILRSILHDEKRLKKKTLSIVLEVLKSYIYYVYNIYKNKFNCGPVN